MPFSAQPLNKSYCLKDGSDRSKCQNITVSCAQTRCSPESIRYSTKSKLNNCPMMNSNSWTSSLGFLPSFSAARHSSELTSSLLPNNGSNKERESKCRGATIQPL